MKSSLSILGLYQWDNTLFDPMTVPAGVDKQTVVNNILMDCAELEVLYSNPDTMKKAISIWSELSQNSWKRMQDALTASYSPEKTMIDMRTGRTGTPAKRVHRWPRIMTPRWRMRIVRPVRAPAHTPGTCTEILA